MSIQPIKIVKRREMLAANVVTMTIDEDRAVTEFRSFEPIAGLYVSRVCNPAALEVMMAINDAIGRQLSERREVLATTQNDFEN